MKYRKTGTKFSIGVIVVIILFAAGCTGINNAIGITPTPTLSPTPSPTPRICPPSSSLATPERIPLSPNLVIYVTNTTDFSGPIEYADGTTTLDALEFVSRVSTTLVGPGDQVAFLRLGYREYDNSRILNRNSPTLEAPLIAATPIPQSTLTPLPTPTDYGQTLFQKTETAREFQQQVSLQDATATQMTFEDDCLMTDWTDLYATQNAEWEATKDAAEQLLGDGLQTDLDQATQAPDTFPTPDPAFGLLEGLSHASIILKQECSRYARCILVIFDSLEEWRVNKDGSFAVPIRLEADLSGVEILVVMRQCQDIYDPICASLQEAWKTVFANFGTTAVEFHDGDDLENHISAFLRR